VLLKTTLETILKKYFEIVQTYMYFLKLFWKYLPKMLFKSILKIENKLVFWTIFYFKIENYFKEDYFAHHWLFGTNSRQLCDKYLTQPTKFINLFLSSVTQLKLPPSSLHKDSSPWYRPTPIPLRIHITILLSRIFSIFGGRITVMNSFGVWNPP